MGGMQKPPSVFVELGPSRIACAAIVLISSATFAVLVAAKVPWIALVGSLCGLVAWSTITIRRVGLQIGPAAVSTIRLQGDDTVAIEYGDGRSEIGTLRTSSTVGARVTTLVWRPKESFCSRAVLILPDMLPADAFRRLRVLMRYGRSEDRQGAPESQA
jgi:Membrane-bound toxin component of toxin-antitoxin system